MKQLASVLVFLSLIIFMLVLNIGCGLAGGRHSDAEVVDSEQAVIVKDSAKAKPAVVDTVATPPTNP